MHHSIKIDHLKLGYQHAYANLPWDLDYNNWKGVEQRNYETGRLWLFEIKAAGRIPIEWTDDIDYITIRLQTDVLLASGIANKKLINPQRVPP